MEHWYTIHTKPHKERQVETVLTTRGLQVYFPVVPAPRHNHRSAQSAFFSCYLFVRADLDMVGLWPLYYAPGVRRVVMFGDQPTKVDDSIITMLRARLAQTDSVYANGEILKPGDRIVITSGPLANIEALFDRSLSPAGRVRILINWLEHGTPVELESALLRKINPVSAHAPSAQETVGSI